MNNVFLPYVAITRDLYLQREGWEACEHVNNKNAWVGVQFVMYFVLLGGFYEIMFLCLNLYSYTIITLLVFCIQYYSIDIRYSLLYSIGIRCVLLLYWY